MSTTGTLTVNLDALVANWRMIDRHVGPDVTASAVIKADAYGLGAERVGAELAAAGCRDFFLATLDEAIAARHFLPPDARVYVLGGLGQAEPEIFARHRLRPVLNAPSSVQQWLDARRRAHAASGDWACGLKFDTGMTRLGLAPESLRQLGAPALREAGVALVMSHLACADEPAHPQNREQLEIFNAVRDELSPALPGVPFSLANSCGVFLSPDYHHHLVRPGAALYGYDPGAPVEPVVTLDLPVIQLRRLQAAARVGYGATQSAPSGTVLAAVAGGYADGLHRVLGRSGSGRCRGESVPVVGRVSMDTTLFDVTNVPGVDEALAAGAADAGWSIRVMDEVQTLSRLSRALDAVGYEVITSLRAGRYRRVYTGGVCGG